MEFNEEQIEKIQEYAGLFMTIKEIAVLLSISYDDLQLEYSSENSCFYKTYQKAMLEKKVALRADVVDAAIAGSPSAQDMTERYITENRIDND